MTFSDLQSKLRPLSSPGTSPPGPLVLNAALVESEDMVALWDAALGTKEFTINEPRVSFSGSQIVVAGKAAMLSIDGMPVEAVFQDANQQLKFRLTATPPDTWTFGQSFPDLPQNFNFDPTNYGYGESYLHSLAFSQPVFVLTTHSWKDPGSTVDFDRGLTFRGQLAPSGPLEGLDLLTGSRNAVLVSGLIRSDKQSSEFCLSAQIPLRLGDNPLAKKLQNVRLKLWNSLSKANGAVARIEVAVQLEIVAGKMVEVYCPLRIGEPPDFLVIGGRFNNLNLPDLGQLAELVGGKDLQEKLPEELRSFGGLSIKEVRTGVSLTGPEVAYALVCVHTTSPWTIVSKILEIDSLFVTWLIESPFKSATRNILCELEGRVRIADASIDLHARFPDYQFSGALSEGSVIKLGALLKHFAPDAPPPDDSLVISSLAVVINPPLKTYAIGARVENVWSLPLGSAKLEIASLSLSLTKTSEQLTGFLAGVMELTLQVDGAERIIDLTLSATLPGSPGGGWQFTGSTGQGQQIPIGALIKMLASMCGEVKLPAAVEKFTIENLSISFNTRTTNFTFGCEGRIPLIEGKPPIEARVDIVIDQEHNQKDFGGDLVIYPAEGQRLDFALKFGSDPKVQTFLAAYYEEGGRKISIDGLLAQVFTEPITTGVELTLKDALFAYRGDGQVARYLFGLNIGIDIGLAKLPVVGPALPPDLQVGVENLQILAATRAFSLPEVNALNKLVPAGATKLPSGKSDGADTALKKGLNVSAKLKLGGTDKLLMLPAPEESAAPDGGPATVPLPPGTPPPVDPPKAETGSSKWFDIQKSLGPMRLERLGVEWKEKRLGFLFDASLDLPGVRLDLLGLSISLPLKNPRFEDLVFGLDGLELSVKQSPLEITGSLLKVSPTDPNISLQYDGRVLVRAQVFSLAALGSYAVINDRPSIFIFAVLHKELGGPGFFFVTGLALGFGVNRLLKLPSIAEVSNFPLIKGAMDPEYFGSNATPRTALEKLQEYIPPSVGNYWVAAGVKFNSFGTIDSFAVLSVSFGTQFQIALLGLSRLVVPRELPEAAPVDPIACAELAIKVTFTPSSGLLAAEGRLTDNSFVFSKNCKIAGGFALYFWFGPEHAGDFLVTLGGYHPKFVPSHYPVVPRLGLNWNVSANLAISGELYFALTPSCLMAGGKLSAVYQAGALRAWFYARADFLINWQPLAYDIMMEVRIGVAFRLTFGDTQKTLSIELGAAVHMWGPPFGGTARVTWFIISFDIAFGKPQQTKLEKVEWKAFQQSFLPQSADAGTDPLVCTIRITSGLIKAQEVTRNGKKSTLSVVNAHELSFTTESVLPATSVLLNKQAVAAVGLAAKPVGIRPMDIKSLNSAHAVTFEPLRPAGSDWDAYLAPTLITSNMPEALWSDKGLTRLERPEAAMIEAVPNGVRVALRNRGPSHGLAPIDLLKFKYEYIPKDIVWNDRQPPQPIPAPRDKTLANTIWNNPSVDATRKAILIALGKDKAQIDLRNLAAASTEIFQSEPEMARLDEPFKQPLFAG